MAFNLSVNATPTGNISLQNNGSLSNSEQSRCDFEVPYRIAICLLLGITMVIASLSNGLFSIAIMVTRNLRTITNMLLVSLSIGDIIISLLLPPCEIIYVYYYPVWPIGRLGTYILNYVWLFSLASPFVSVTIITIDRYMVITSRSHENGWRKPKSVAFAVAINWIYSFGVVSLMAYNFDQPSDDSYEWNVKVEYYYPFICIHIAIPLVIITVLYLQIIKAAKQSRTQASYTSNATQVALALREYKLAKTISILIGLMLLVWLPVLVMEYFYAVESESCLVSKMGVVSVWFTCVNGMLNPIVYSRRNAQLRHGIRSIFEGCLFGFCERKKESTNNNSTTSASSAKSSDGVKKASWRQRELYPGLQSVKDMKSTETLTSCL